MHLDIGLIPVAGAGFYYLMKYNRVISLIALLLLASTALYAAYELSSASKPFVDEDEIKYISSLQNIEEDAYAMSIINFYTPWVAGYSGKETIDPCLLDFNKWSVIEWDRFWRTSDPVETAKILSIYDKPIYIYLGKKIHLLNESKFSGDCFEKILDENGVQIYRFSCYNGSMENKSLVN
ncbi:MAG TPA: hypothetical protein EYP30_05465 [Archaeoglobaceae archaeon]|nr:hypothetical protein [Archaeoglobaceae archaeon]